VIARLAILGILEDDADEFIADHHFNRVLLVGPRLDADRVQPEQRPQVLLDTQDFSLVHEIRAPIERYGDVLSPL
jgi:hypothetical protein